MHKLVVRGLEFLRLMENERVLGAYREVQPDPADCAAAPADCVRAGVGRQAREAVLDQVGAVVRRLTAARQGD